MSTTEEQIESVLKTWAAVEVAADIAGLDAITDANFVLVGPAGFVLDKSQWLQRYQSGDLTTASLDLSEIQLRLYEDTAISVAVQTQEASYGSRPAGGRFRTTHVLRRSSGGDWLLVSQHLSPIMAPPGAPARG